MKRPVVSAIISTYNSEKFIRGKIEDILSQSIGSELEIIIINSGSTQNEDEIIKEYLTHPNIKYIQTKERETIYRAWNKGIKIASGTFVTNANTDDRLRKDAIELMVNFLVNKPNVALVYTNQIFSSIPNSTFEENKGGKIRYPPKFSRLKLLHGYMAGSQSLWRNSLHLNDNIWFDEKYEVAGDYDFICRVAEKYEIKKLNKVLGVFYKSVYKSNKEDQNIELTHIEAAEVKNIYGRRYIHSLSMKELNNLELKLKLLAYFPEFFWRIINKLYFIFSPGFFTINKLFVYWLLSVIKEHKKEIVEAKRIIEPFQKMDTLPLIKVHLSMLDSVGRQV
jgi:O-antigen biosynthesis protein